jgi:hypothetical protein
MGFVNVSWMFFFLSISTCNNFECEMGRFFFIDKGDSNCLNKVGEKHCPSMLTTTHNIIVIRTSSFIATHGFILLEMSVLQNASAIH